MFLLLVRAQRLSPKSVNTQPRNAADELTTNFLLLVDAHATVEHHLQWYANQLGVTVGHLTETVKEETGQPAGLIVRKRIVLESKRWLAHSDETSAQVAEKMNFADPSYFGRFFKRETGQTPRAFRAAFREKFRH